MATIHQIKVTLEGIKPAIWRRFQVPSDISLKNLHQVLQAVMGWGDVHLYQFVADGVRFAEPDAVDGRQVESVAKTKLSEIAPAVGARLAYEYDFGDNWRHELLVERIMQVGKGAQYPSCLAGERSCPPEDCGGDVGYEELLEALRDRRHPDHVRMRAWLGRAFDSEAFDLNAINGALKRLR